MGAKARAFLEPPSDEELVRRLPCLVCRRRIGHTYGPSEAHHWPTRGAGNHTQVVPLCAHHHRRFHDMGQRSWQAHYGIDLQAETEAVRRYGESHRAD